MAAAALRFCDPKGIATSSPGLRGNELRWVAVHGVSNPKGTFFMS